MTTRSRHRGPFVGFVLVGALVALSMPVWADEDEDADTATGTAPEAAADAEAESEPPAESDDTDAEAADSDAEAPDTDAEDPEAEDSDADIEDPDADAADTDAEDPDVENPDAADPEDAGPREPVTGDAEADDAEAPAELPKPGEPDPASDAGQPEGEGAAEGGDGATAPEPDDTAPDNTAPDGEGSARLVADGAKKKPALDATLTVACEGFEAPTQITVETAGVGEVASAPCPSASFELAPAFYQVTARDGDGDSILATRIELGIGAEETVTLVAPADRDWVEVRVFGGGAFASNIGILPLLRAEIAVLIADGSTFELAPLVRIAFDDGQGTMGALAARVGSRFDIFDILIGAFLGYGTLASSGELASATDPAFRAGISVVGGLILADLFTLRAGIDFHLTSPSTTEGVLGIGVRF